MQTEFGAFRSLVVVLGDCHYVLPARSLNLGTEREDEASRLWNVAARECDSTTRKESRKFVTTQAGGGR